MPAPKTTTVESLLGVLSLGPMSGYEIRQMMERSTANFWSESFGQIYPALKSMLAEGLIELAESAAPANGTRERKVYRITDAGRERLTEWLAVPAKPQVNREELLLKVFFGDKAGPGVMVAQVQARRARFAAELARFQAIERELETHWATHPGMPYWRMTVRYGIGEARMVVDWCDRTLAELHTLESHA